jgi:hypothetical protein
MRSALLVALLVIGARAASAGDGDRPPEIPVICITSWPDPAIPVPDLVDLFILAECQDSAGITDEDLSACIAGERHGYRATLMMLSDPKTGEYAAERYRDCRAGLRMDGGRFHRRRADCMGRSFGYLWRFESTARALIQQADAPLQTAATGGSEAPPVPGRSMRR